jgi:NAD+ diphosphatase
LVKIQLSVKCFKSLNDSILGKMKIQRFAFAGPPLNRHAEIRGKTQDFQAFLRNKKTACVQCRGDMVLMQKNLLSTEFPSGQRDVILLGEDTSGCFWTAAQADESNDLAPVRTLMIEGLLDAPTLSIVAQAKSLLHWHENHKHCSKCGAATKMTDLGYRRHCEACGGDHFPRTDPVVIMAVTFGRKILLGRQKAWTPGMFSALAGFVEPGETMEAAVAREVKEEAGVDIANVRYVATQPWPFPSSLMIGVIAEAKSETLTIDNDELEAARWFDVEEVKLMLKRKHPEGLFASHPYAIAHTLVKAAVRELG